MFNQKSIVLIFLSFFAELICGMIILTCIFISCTGKDNFTGTWISTDQNLYIGTKIEFFKNQKVILSNLPKDKFIIFSEEQQETFDSNVKEGFLNKKERSIRFQNYSKEESSYITFMTSSEMFIVFFDGTCCYFEKQQ